MTLLPFFVVVVVFLYPISPPRQVHISKATLDCLDGIYQTENGHGQERSEFLRKHNIDTYLIRPAPREEAKPQKLRRPSYDEMTTWSAELPFGDILGMNFVRTKQVKLKTKCFLMNLIDVFWSLWRSVDPRHFHQRLSHSAAQSDCSSIWISGSQQKNPTVHGGPQQRADEEGAHHHLHSGVQGCPDGGKGDFHLLV